MLVFYGPGGTAFDQSLAATMARNIDAGGRSCDVFQHDSGTDVVGKCLDALKRDTSGRPSLLVSSHGDVKGGQHHLNLEGEYAPTGQFFDTIAGVTRRPVDLFLTACHGAAALRDAHRLPPGSSVAVIAPGNETVSSTGVEKLANNLGSAHSLDAKNLLLTYCTTLNNRFAPSFWSDGRTHSLDSMMKARLGRPFTGEDKQRARESLAHLLPADRIDEVIGKIEKARNEYDGIWAVDYGPALAIVGAIDLPNTTKP